ncbi:Radical SAM [hydrothermal vent metagenome]|uniref:Radical SAM n=1 Tax=hydrothermal vent metagenome TaxID=652676 RepID=A0A1W1EI89_9ZZZZ
MKFYKVFIEITNICGLKCSFCPTKELNNQIMDLITFEKIVSQLPIFTKEVALHIMGDPLVLSNLEKYLNIIYKYNLKALITTSGYFISNHKLKSLMHPSIKQINISLNSFNKNDISISLDEYLEPIFKLIEYKRDNKIDKFINLRIWNLDEGMSEIEFNREVFAKISNRLNIELDIDKIYQQNPKNIRLVYKTLLHFDKYFEWPSLNNQIYGDGSCQGLQSHFGILSNGVVVPCCLDGDGVMELGNINNSTIKDILESKKAQSIIDGFKNSKAVEELCRKCSYKDRFKK